MDDRFIETFREEAYELLDQMENDLLSLEEDPKDQGHIQSVFRAAHTIKGSAGMFGFKTISSFAHEFENALENVRSGESTITRDMISLTLRAKDHLRAMLAVGRDELPEELNQVSAAILAELERLNKQEGTGAATIDTEKFSPPPETKAEEKTYRISFTPPEDIFERGTNPILLLHELQELGDCSVFADISAVPSLAELDPEKLYISWEVLLTTEHPFSEIQDVFIFVESDSKLIIEELDPQEYLDRDGEVKRLGEILVDRGDLEPKKLRELLEKQKRIGERISEAGLTGEREIESAVHAQEHFKQTVEKAHKDRSSATLRVSSERLDQLIDLVGELVTVQARMNSLAGSMDHDGFGGISEELERLIDDLRDNAMSLRMLPIGSTFSQFRRMVRDLSQELGKSIELITSGEETELDKTVLDKLHDPLVHIIRNAIDHGIESPEKRLEAGKEETGKIYLEALHSGASVLIVIRDDGAGIDSERVRQRAVERGIISAQDKLSREEIFQLIFAPGFSTAEQVTSVSGRGVGLDVVAKDIQALSGTATIDSEEGRGSSFTLSLPLTLAIIDGLRIAVGEEIFIVPLSAVESCLEIDPSEIDQRRRMINHRGSLLPFISLASHLGIADNGDSRKQMVIVETAKGALGLLVDEVLGDHQTVIKGLGRLFRKQKAFSGATIMGDGSISLILDVHALLAASEEEKAEENGRD